MRNLWVLCIFKIFNFAQTKNNPKTQFQNFDLTLKILWLNSSIICNKHWNKKMVNIIIVSAPGAMVFFIFLKNNEIIIDKKPPYSKSDQGLLQRISRKQNQS